MDAVYSEALLERFLSPKWAGDVELPTAVVTEGNPACGDVVQLAIRVNDGAITEARFRTLGCAIAIASSDCICDLIEGGTISAAEVVDIADLGSMLGGIPEERSSCAQAALAALRSAVRRLRTDAQVR